MIKAVFFDFDGVLTTDAKGSLTISKNLCEVVPGLPVDDVFRAYREDIEPLNTGRMTLQELWEHLCTKCHIQADYEVFLQVLRKTPLNHAMFDVARELARQYVVGIITDNSRERMEILCEEFRLRDSFKPIVVSADVRASKCDGSTKIFDVALAAAGCNAEESLFIDNQEKNLVVPTKMGMKTYLHDVAINDIGALRRALKQLGI